jgi:RNA polymerase sigma factor (TIGR02999 family)
MAVTLFRDLTALGGRKVLSEMTDGTLTKLLQTWSDGDQEAAMRVLPLVYDELHHIATRQLRQKRGGHTLQATAVVHEAYLHLRGQVGFEWSSRAHFFAFAARLIRRILVDNARHRVKRGGGLDRVTLAEAVDLAMERMPDLEPSTRRSLT